MVIMFSPNRYITSENQRSDADRRDKGQGDEARTIEPYRILGSLER